MRRHVVMGTGFALSMLLTAASASAQTTGSMEAGVQFDFSLPGARSLGMGGAFVAVADDASAAQTNPAGLTVLTRPEFSVEGRGWNFFSSFPDVGHAFGSPTGVGSDTIPGIQYLELKDTPGAVALISFVYPKERWAIAGYRHQLANFTNRAKGSGPFFTRGNDVGRFNNSQGEIDVDIVSYGGSAAYRLNDKFSIGFGAGFYTFSINVENESYMVAPHGATLTPAQRPLYTGVGQQFGPPDFSAGNAIFRQEQFGDDTAFAVNAGFLWSGEKFTVGGAFRQGPVFEYDSRFVFGPAFGPEFGNLGGTEIQFDEGIKFHVPDSYSIGVSYRPTDRVMVTGEYNRVQYSELINGDGEGKPVETTGKFSQYADAQARAEGVALVNNIRIDNTNQVRVGSEVVVKKAPGAILLRVGTWYDPDHRQRFENPDPTNQILRQYEIGMPPGSDEVHFASGVGFAFKSMRLDAAFDLSPRINTYSLSAVIYF